MMIPLQPYIPWKVSLTIFHALAIISTGLRLEHRRRTKKLWWDDLVTVVPIMLEGLNITILWLRIRDHRDTPLKYRILMSYGNTVCFTTILWFSRISLAFAVVRITPSWTKSRRIAIWLTITLIFFWLGLLLYLILTCTIHNEWQHAKTDVLICPPKRHVSVGFTAFDVISDLALVAIPLNLLWNMNHASSQRRLVRLVFSASVLTLLASLCLCIVAYAGFMEGPGALLLWSMVCYILTGVSIITSNFLVLVSWFYQYLFRERDPADESDVYITPHWTRNHQLQPERVDLQRVSVLPVPRSTITMIASVASDVSTTSERSKE